MMKRVEQSLVEIGSPSIQVSVNGRMRLTCPVRVQGVALPEQVYYEVDATYGDYLVDSRSDAFLVGLLPLILGCGGKVRCAAPVSAHLLHNLRYRLANVVRDFEASGWRSLEIEAESDDSPLGGSHVGTGCSCGVDSCATIAVYSDPDVPKDMRIDTLAFFNVGSHGDCRHATVAEREKRDALFAGRLERVRMFAAAAGMPLLVVDSNLQEFGMGLSHKATETFRNTSAVLALAKWFGAYHCASAHKATRFSFTLHSIARSDIYLLDCFSTESTRFHSALSAYSRYERLALIGAYEPALRYLDVCVDRVGNCLRCVKCVRTLFQLEMWGKLDSFSSVFDVAGFRSHPWRMLTRAMKDKAYHCEYVTQMEEMQGCGHRLPLPFWVYRLSFFISHWLETCSELRHRVKVAVRGMRRTCSLDAHRK